MTAPDGNAVAALAQLRAMVEKRLIEVSDDDAGEGGPYPLQFPREVDFGAVNMYLYAWAGVLLGVTLAQNAVDGNPDAPGRAIPPGWMLAAALGDGQFWSDDGDMPGWPPVRAAGLPLTGATA